MAASALRRRQILPRPAGGTAGNGLKEPGRCLPQTLRKNLKGGLR